MSATSDFFVAVVPFRLRLPHELSESLMHRPLIGISSFDYSAVPYQSLDSPYLLEY